jgi:tetratricopeptide (TPR) repeat protein
MDNHTYLREAKISFASGQLEKSIDLFTIAEGKGCDLVDVCLSRGAAQMALGHFQEAKKDFSRVLSVDAKNERAYYFRGIACVALGEYEDAIEDLTFSLARNNDRGIAHLARGLAYAELGLEHDAVLDFNGAEAFSEAELQSFRRLFGDMPSPFQNSKALLAKENAPWNNLLSRNMAERLSNLLQ